MIDYSQEENIKDSEKLYEMFETINNCPKPVIGLINGHALGGGMGLISVCDYALTHNKAKFGFTETRLGLVPAVISSFCLNRIGENHARAWFLSGEKFNGEQAKLIGLVHEVCSVENFEKRSSELIESFMQAGPIAMIKAKELINIVLESDNIKKDTCLAIAQRRVSAEGQEGMSALLEKRKAKWMER